MMLHTLCVTRYASHADQRRPLAFYVVRCFNVILPRANNGEACDAPVTRLQPHARAGSSPHLQWYRPRSSPSALAPFLRDQTAAVVSLQPQLTPRTTTRQECRQRAAAPAFACPASNQRVTMSSTCCGDCDRMKRRYLQREFQHLSHDDMKAGAQQHQRQNQQHGQQQQQQQQQQHQ